MKVRINKRLLSQLPDALRAMVEDHRSKGAAFISVEHTAKVYCAEDARYTAFNASFDSSHQEQAGGEFSGCSRLSPTAVIPLPSGCTIVEQGFSFGKRYLVIHHNPAPGSVLPVLGPVGEIASLVQ